MTNIFQRIGRLFAPPKPVDPLRRDLAIAIDAAHSAREVLARLEPNDPSRPGWKDVLERADARVAGLADAVIIARAVSLIEARCSTILSSAQKEVIWARFARDGVVAGPVPVEKIGEPAPQAPDVPIWRAAREALRFNANAALPDR